MPVHSNPRREIFCQEIAKGSSNREAYEASGYEVKNQSAADACASRLLSDAKVLARIAEIQNNGAARAALSVQRIIEKLDKAYDLAEELRMPTSMVTAAMGQAKVAGLIVDKKEIGAPGDFDRMTDEDLDEFIKTEAADLLPKSGGRSATRH